MRLLKRRGQDHYVDGFLLLSLCQKLVAEATRARPAQPGTPDDPYVVQTAAGWTWCWSNSANSDLKYYKIAGRLILKNARLYVGDIGPAYLKGTDRDDSARKAAAQFLSGTVRQQGAYRIPVANVSAEKIEAWKRRNTDDDPTYRSGAARIQDPGKIFRDSTEQLAIYGHKPAPWNTLAKSPALARVIRAMLKGQALPRAGQPGFTSDYSRLQTFFPVFTAAIFLAEPARNARAWPINLMLLDLAERGHARYAWDAILWHPDAVNPDPRVTCYFGPGPQGRNPGQRNIVDITSPSQLHLVGGILPASPTGGGERGGPSLYRAPKPLSPEAIAHGGRQGPGQVLNVPYDFIHQKEINVLLPWLMRIGAVSALWEIVPGPPHQHAVAVAPTATLARPNDVLAAQGDLAPIRDAIAGRIASLDHI